MNVAQNPMIELPTPDGNKSVSFYPTKPNKLHNIWSPENSKGSKFKFDGIMGSPDLEFDLNANLFKNQRATAHLVRRSPRNSPDRIIGIERMRTSQE